MSPDNIALTGLHFPPEFHAEVTGSGPWTGWTKVHLATLRSDPSVEAPDEGEGLEGVRHGHPVDHSRGGAPARWWGLGILPLA